MNRKPNNIKLTPEEERKAQILARQLLVDWICTRWKDPSIAEILRKKQELVYKVRLYMTCAVRTENIGNNGTTV